MGDKDKDPKDKDPKDKSTNKKDKSGSASGKPGSKKSGAHGGHASFGGFPHSFGGYSHSLGDAETDAGMPVLGYKSKGPKSKKKVKFATVEPEKVDIQYDPDLYEAVVEDNKITPVKGPDSMSLKRVKKLDPSIAQRVMGPAAKDKEQTKQRPKQDDIMAKLARANKMKQGVGKLNKGEDPDEDLYTLNPVSLALAQKQSQAYHAAMYQASIPPTYGGRGYGNSTYGGRGTGRGRGGSGRGRGGSY